jgi:diaminopimelate decarboxylase
MDYFTYKNDIYSCEDVSLLDLAKEYGTPLFVYSANTVRRHIAVFLQAFAGKKHMLCYSVKVNSNLAILKMLVGLKVGFDVVSQGEIQKVLYAGAKGRDIVFSGVGKTADEIKFAIENDIYCFNVESYPELLQIERIAKHLNKKAPIAIRVNPDIDAKTHPFISTGMSDNKFGISVTEVIKLYKYAKQSKNLNIIGIDCHIGSQITQISPFTEAVDRILLLIDELKKFAISINHIDMGGGLGVCYQDESPPTVQEWIGAILAKIPDGMKLVLEPGRSIMANAGVLLTHVTYIKKTQDKNFIIVDAAMNDLIRPSLYQAYHRIIPVVKNSGKSIIADVVGPICESTDFIGKNRTITTKTGDLLVVRTTGAYAFCMSSNYNTRPRAAQIMVDGKKHQRISKRESFFDMIKNEI